MFLLYSYSVLQYIHRVVQLSAKSNFKIFSSPKKETQYSLEVISHFPGFDVPGNHFLTACIYRLRTYRISGVNYYIILWLAYFYLHFVCVSSWYIKYQYGLIVLQHSDVSLLWIYQYTTFAFPFTSDEHAACFYFLALMNCISMNINGVVLRGKLFLWTYAEVQLLSHTIM